MSLHRFETRNRGGFAEPFTVGNISSGSGLSYVHAAVFLNPARDEKDEEN